MEYEHLRALYRDCTKAEYVNLGVLYTTCNLTGLVGARIADHGNVISAGLVWYAGATVSSFADLFFLVRVARGGPLDGVRFGYT